MYWEFVDKSSLETKEEIYSNIHFDKSIEEITGPGYLLKDLDFRFSIAEDFLCNKISYLIRFIKEDSDLIVKQNKVSGVLCLINAIYSEIKEYDKIAQKESLDEFQEGIYKLWKHYLCNIQDKVAELENEYEFLLKKQEIIHCLNNSECCKENVFFRNHSNDLHLDCIDEVDFNENRILPRETLNFAIALYFYYTNQKIDTTNSKEISRLYGRSANRKLEDAYDTAKNEDDRIHHKLFEKACNQIYNYLPPESKLKVDGDLEKRKGFRVKR